MTGLGTTALTLGIVGAIIVIGGAVRMYQRPNASLSERRRAILLVAMTAFIVIMMVLNVVFD